VAYAGTPHFRADTLRGANHMNVTLAQTAWKSFKKKKKKPLRFTGIHLELLWLQGTGLMDFVLTNTINPSFSF